ncbi:MAG: 2,3-dimethylmalate lyase [Frankiales bacterium]|nr:2,3-dimethylmalate lyase [Frankiales bacterium]
MGRLRDAIQSTFPADGLLVPGVYDALSARIAERVGFEAVYLSGTATAAAVHGLPDLGVIGRAEMVANCARVSSAIQLPVIADADTGYGNAVAVRATVHDFLRAGAAAITLEDQPVQKQCGYTSGVELADVSEMQRRIDAACRARGTDDLLVIGRTDALPTLGLEAALLRATAMSEAGADLVWVLGLQRHQGEELRTVRSEIRGPAMVDYTELPDSPVHSADELYALGFQVVLVALTAVLVSIKAMEGALGQLRQTGDWSGYQDRLMPFEKFNELAGFAEAREFESAAEQRFPG